MRDLPNRWRAGVVSGNQVTGARRLLRQDCKKFLWGTTNHTGQEVIPWLGYSQGEGNYIWQKPSYKNHTYHCQTVEKWKKKFRFKPKYMQARKLQAMDKVVRPSKICFHCCVCMTTMTLSQDFEQPPLIKIAAVLVGCGKNQVTGVEHNWENERRAAAHWRLNNAGEYCDWEWPTVRLPLWLLPLNASGIKVNALTTEFGVKTLDWWKTQAVTSPSWKVFSVYEAQPLLMLVFVPW